MDIQVITDLIGQLGFPIAMCCYMAWYINKSEERHKAEVDKMSEALNNNTLVMQQLVDKLNE